MGSPVLGNPVRGPLHPFGWSRPAGNTDMVITQTAAQHHAKPSATTGLPAPMALDIGDGAPDLDDILAPHAGVVAQALTVGSANLSIDWFEGAVKWRVVLAHNTLPHPVGVGQAVALGQVVGKMGQSSVPSMPVPLHLHIQVGYWNGTAFVWVDPWPLFAQNAVAEDELDPSFAPKPNRTTTVNAGARHRLAPTAADPANVAIASDPGGPLGFPLLGTVVGVPPPNAPGNAIWYAYWRPETKKVYFIHTSACGPETPWEATGHSDAELAKAASAAAGAVAAAAVTQAKTYP